MNFPPRRPGFEWRVGEYTGFDPGLQSQDCCDLRFAACSRFHGSDSGKRLPRGNFRLRGNEFHAREAALAELQQVFRACSQLQFAIFGDYAIDTHGAFGDLARRFRTGGREPSFAQQRAAACSPSAGPPTRMPAASASPAPVGSSTSTGRAA